MTHPQQHPTMSGYMDSDSFDRFLDSLWAHRPAADRVLALRAEPPSGVSSLRASPDLRVVPCPEGYGCRGDLSNGER